LERYLFIPEEGSKKKTHTSWESGKRSCSNLFRRREDFGRGRKEQNKKKETTQLIITKERGEWDLNNEGP